jgi:anti-anti-sigma factor
MDKLTLDSHEQSGMISVRVQGFITLLTIHQLKDGFDIWVRPGNRKIVLDLAGMKLIDSTGIGVLFMGIRACRDSNIDFKVRNVPKSFRVVMEATGLSGIFEN